MAKEHHYKATTTWTGNEGTGTSNYRAYSRNHIISIEGKEDIKGSSDPSFRGDRTRYNPEEMLVSSLSTCHMLWYLHFCSEAGVIVTDYKDEASGIMTEDAKGAGVFKEVTLHPHVTVADASMVEKAESLHAKANEYCFIANSVNFPVKHQASCEVGEAV